MSTFAFQTVRASPDRTNITLNVHQRLPQTGGDNTAASSHEAVLSPLIDDLHVDVNSFPKTIIFSKLKWCGEGHELALRPKPNGLSVASEVSNSVAQFHAPCTKLVSNPVFFYVTYILFLHVMSVCLHTH